MKPVPRTPSPPKLKQWRAALIRQRLELLGRVAAPDRETAEAAAVEEFHLDDWQRKRLVLQEML
jgi:hypothetical protein